MTRRKKCFEVGLMPIKWINQSRRKNKKIHLFFLTFLQREKKILSILFFSLSFLQGEFFLNLSNKIYFSGD